MKQMVRWAAAALLAGLSGTAAAGGNVTGSVGARVMDEDYWAPVESQTVIGALADFSFGSAPVHLALGLQASFAEGEAFGIDFTGTVIEWSAGVKLMPQHGLVRPFVGVGLVATRAELEGSGSGNTVSDSDSSGGHYIEGGVMWRFARHVDAGFNVRLIGGTDVELFGAKGDADAVAVTGIVGYGWGD